MLHGSCLCKAIGYEVDEVVGDYVFCCCRSCRKASGSAFGANVSVPVDGFRVHDPDGHLRVYESSPGKRRHFCGNCGSPLYTTVGPAPEVVRLRLGTLDSDFDAEPSAHIFVGEKAKWYTPDDRRPRFEAWPDPGALRLAGSRQDDD